MIPHSIVEKEKLQSAIDNAAGITKRNIIKFQDYMPIYCTKSGLYPYQKTNAPIDNNYNWAKGFWAGIVWLLYELEPRDYIRIYAEGLTKNINSNLNKRGLLHSNMGFLVIPGCIPNYRTTKSSTAKETVIMAANNLITKYSSANRFICYYEHELDGDVLCCIISNLINSQLLNFAYEFSGNGKYKELAQKDIDTVINNNILPNGQCFFNSYFNKTTGERLEGRPTIEYKQREGVPLRSYNYSDGFSTRAYAWALYGLSICYAFTKNEFYKNKFSDVFDFLEKSCGGNEIYFDNFNAVRAKHYPDSISTAIIAAALSDFIKNPGVCDDKYTKTLSRLANALIDKHSVTNASNKECLILNGYISEYTGASASTLFGDYFYFEMLMNLCGDRDSFWYMKRN